MAFAQLTKGTARFSVVLPKHVYESLVEAQGDRTWRQLAQDCIKAYAAQLPTTNEAAIEKRPSIQRSKTA